MSVIPGMRYFTKKRRKKMASKKWELHGYYFDGKKSWVMYIDEYGNIKTRRWYE